MVNGEYDYIAAFIDDFPSYNPTSILDGPGELENL